MRDLPILFNDAMVRATLDGWKTQTRRPVKRENPPEPGMQWAECLCHEIDPSDTPCVVCAHRFGASPFGGAGSRLWVREAWAPLRLSYDFETGYCDDIEGCPAAEVRDYLAQNTPGIFGHKPTRGLAYRADECHETHKDDRGFNWRPSIHMPRWASRITLPVVRVWVERVQDITASGVFAEGLRPCGWGRVLNCGGKPHRETFEGEAERARQNMLREFARLWDGLYPGSWDRNEWVWACEFGEPEVRSACARCP